MPTRGEINHIEIPQLESDLEEEEQFEDLQTYLTHHNTYQESQNIRKEYRKRLLDLDDDRYYQEIDCAYETYGPTQDYIPVNQAPGPHRMTQELMQIFSKGRSGTQGRAPWKLTFWSKNKISVEQNTMKDQENTTYVTEVCEHSIISWYNNLICP